MGDDDALLAAVAASPNDDAPRLVYADWLDERGDQRGEFLRLEVRLAAGCGASGDRDRLNAVARQLDVRWVAAVCRVPVEIGDSFEHPARFELNVAGPFYTLGNCMACDAPETEAPELLAPLVPTNYRTYFVRQPATADEVDRACRAASVCCVADLRYGGTDPAVIAQLGNTPEYCDFVMTDDGPRLIPASEVERPIRLKAKPAGVIVRWSRQLWAWVRQVAAEPAPAPDRTGGE
jgi:uncharacterized protein (TIGR02996 family)